MSAKNELKERTDNKLKEPRQYCVVMLNDDFTSMDFVVKVLVDIFHKDPATAEQLMMTVHKNGRAVVGIYPYDVAATKVNAALDRAKAEGFPFRMTIEEA
ncbi:MAG: ATP-dependent Clp protease adaptor ClpS [Lachnospiraceae bacterium]|nr:ATP-dependent Clp protease adaptor ClpS [Lachnospiraceae bacterium]MCR5768422.1 ATP-dependent Clp protease adaptor ClpS [Lachnospiraceae bacterium]